jgi:murein DD-endopeptidase MepM/ murein hydrolase activator NlpD
MQRLFITLPVVLALAGFWRFTMPAPPPAELPAEPVSWEQFWSADLAPALPVAARFELPLFPPDGAGAYVKRGFREGKNLGEDWVLEPGTPAAAVTVGAVADGVVILADDFGAVWGRVVIILHRMPAGSPWPAVESMYANLATLAVGKGDLVGRGRVIGTLGATPISPAPELHWEIRAGLGHQLGPGEAEEAGDWIHPTRFIEEYRGGK